MSEVLIGFCLFVLKGITVALLMIIVVAVITALKGKGGATTVEFEYLNETLDKQLQTILKTFSKIGTASAQSTLKKYHTNRKLQKKADKKEKAQRKRSFVLTFKGDMKASHVAVFRDEITAIMQVAGCDDEVVVVLESPGGAVSSYGLVASQLVRIKQAKLRLTVCVDMVAASGGYMAAVVADRILAAPFAFIGSIGVVVTMPNFYDFLQNKDVNMIELTAGKHKRSISMLGKCTEEGKKQTMQQLKAIHEQFKDLVSAYRPQVDIETVATGEYWTAKNAMRLGLVDDLTTSDSYIAELVTNSDVWAVSTPKKKTLKHLFTEASQAIFEQLETRLRNMPLL